MAGILESKDLKMTIKEIKNNARKAKADCIRETRRIAIEANIELASQDKLGILQKRTNKIARDVAENVHGPTPKPTAFESLGIHRTQFSDDSVSIAVYDDEGGGEERSLLSGKWLDADDETIAYAFGLQYYCGGPGQPFSRGYISRGKNSILTTRTWGLDI